MCKRPPEHQLLAQYLTVSESLELKTSESSAVAFSFVSACESGLHRMSSSEV